VTNTGQRVSDLALLALIEPPSGNDAPRQQLWQFERIVRLAPGETRRVAFVLRRAQLVGWHGAASIVRGRYVFRGPLSEHGNRVELHVV
jgi:hypothetical protein